MYDVIALGELLIDFTPVGETVNDNPVFEQNTGGAPANVLAVLSKFGKKTAFIGKVGQDEFGNYLSDTLEQYGVGTGGLVRSSETPTTLAFVHLDNDGDRSFSFYRNPGADMMLKKNEINEEIINQTKIFHFGSLSLTSNPAAEATKYAINIAIKHNKIISFDPNLREALWGDLDMAKEQISYGLEVANLVKMSEEELFFMTNETSLQQAAREIQRKYDLPFLFITLGKNGCYYLCGDKEGFVPGYKVPVQDTTGAGDAFFGSILNSFLDFPNIDKITEKDFDNIVSKANATGALATTKKGAFGSFPDMKEVKHFLEQVKVAK